MSVIIIVIDFNVFIIQLFNSQKKGVLLVNSGAVIMVSVCAGKNVLDKTAIVSGESAKGIVLCWFIFVFMFCFLKR